ncbi:MAG TPA: phytanoyl-CoA dioxygenase family protein [Pyrinomonadaceae bacterium]|nr:phytanoyl-CoA dioxygenase family protein [Pyrinomonadaceae bacterium]HMP65304.1 phytanoyl-CoA dioxygenase family protein [Pyrinomonadaceae bacterium]
MTLVSSNDVDHLSAKGWVLVRNVARDHEIAALRSAVSSAVERFAAEARSLDQRDTYSKAFLQVTDLWQKDGAVRAGVFTRRFAQVAADLLGVERVRLYHDQALFKEPGGGPTPWHQDMYYWPLATEKTVTMWMPLVDVTEEMGLMRFAEGSHKDLRRTDLEISDESEAFYSAQISDHGYRVGGPEAMRAGDATFHLGWTIHSAGPNLTTDRMREIMTVIYFPDGTRILEPANTHQRADLSAFLGGRLPGDLADSDQNPVLN